MRNGNFGQIVFDENGGCSFLPITKWKDEREHSQEHFLAQN